MQIAISQSIRAPTARLAKLATTLMFASCMCQPASTKNSATDCSGGIKALPPVGTTLYHGVYPGGSSGEEGSVTPADTDAYIAAVGAKPAWIYFSHDWYRSRRFPTETVRWIRDRGALPFVRLMLRSSSDTRLDEQVYTLAAINRGDFDADLRAWGAEARDFGSPLAIEWGTEANGDWFRWNGRWNGGPGAGPAAFRAAYRRIVREVCAGGGRDLTWVFHVNGGDQPDEDWNRPRAYYPGDDVIDWLGVSVYGAQSPTEPEWPEFRAVMDDAVARTAAVARSKPLFLLEFGVTAGHPQGDPTVWADSALRDLTSGRWPEVRGFSWWNEHWANDDDPAHDSEMRVQYIPGMAAVFRERLGAAALQSEVGLSR